MITVEIPIKNPRKPPKLVFPDHCVHCGKPAKKTWAIKLSTGTQTKRGQMSVLEMNIPLCADCTALENRIGNVTWIPFFLAGLLTCVIVFIPVWLLSPEGTTPQTYEFPYVLGAFVGMIAGILAGTLVEFVLKMIMAPAYGKLLLKRPLTVFSVLNDSEDLVGISLRFGDHKKNLKVIFENDELAREFIALNPQENG
jgi:hypothetical protein